MKQNKESPCIINKMPRIFENHHTKNQKNHINEKIKSTNANTKMKLILELSDCDFKATITSVIWQAITRSSKTSEK